MRPALLVLGAMLVAVGIGVWLMPGPFLPIVAILLVGDGIGALAVGAWTKDPDRLAEEALAEFQARGPLKSPLRQSTIPEWARSVWWYSPCLAVAVAGVAFLSLPSWGLAWLGPVLVLEGILSSTLVYFVARRD